MNQWVEIVGVVGDFPPHGMEPGQADAKIYHALGPGRVHPATLAIRLRGTDPTSFAPKLRDITAAVDPTLRADAVLPLDKVLTQGQGMIRVGALAIALLTASVLLLSAAGIYAMMSFTITQRRKEIGIRTALGADPRHILSNVFARASRQLLVGVSVGIVAAVLLDRLAEGDLTGGHAAVVVPSVAVLMVVVGLLATLGPARRCLRIDPTDALKADG